MNNRDKLSNLAQEFGLPKHMILSLLSAGVPEKVMRKACCEPDDDEADEEVDEIVAYYLKRNKEHAKKSSQQQKVSNPKTGITQS